MATAYSYIRFSTPEQKKGDSLRRQMELSEDYAKENGLFLDSSLHMHDLGLSAFDRSNIERGALGGFLEAIKQDRIPRGSYLLVESLDRLSRDKVLAALSIFIEILQHGITIVTLADRMVYNTQSVGDSFAKLIISITIMARAHEESVAKSRRQKATWVNKRSIIDQKKLTAQCPRWMQLNSEKTVFTFIPERVNLVKEILGLIKAGIGQQQIAKRLNLRAEPPFSSHGTGWHGSYIHKIVTSTSLYGEMQPHVWVEGKLIPEGEPRQNYFPALISKEEFYLIQNIRALRNKAGGKARKGSSIPNLLSGIVKCGYCGRSMILASGQTQRFRLDDGTVKRNVKKVLVCDGGRRGYDCYAIQWDYLSFEASFLTFCRTLNLKKLLNDRKILDAGKARRLSTTEQLQSIDSAISDNEKKLKRLISTIEQQDDVPSSLFSRIREIEEILKNLRETREMLVIELKSIDGSEKNRLVEVETVRELITQMEALEGDDLFLTRASLAEHIRHLIQTVQVFPAGTLHSPDAIESIREELLKEEYSPKRVDAYIDQTYRSTPKRTGNGIRGRYESPKHTGRYFTIKSKDGGFRVVYPEFDDPYKVTVDISIKPS